MNITSIKNHITFTFSEDKEFKPINNVKRFKKKIFQLL